MQNYIFKTFQKHPYRVLFFLFLLSFIIRFLWADFYKAFYIYPDELRYYQIAENLAHGRGLLVYNLPIDFQKILYSIFLIPAFLFENRETQQHMLALINALLVTSTIFPLYLIAKQLLNNQKLILFICVFSLFFPDLSYSMTFMSENLFLPLSLLVFSCYLKIILNKEKQKTLFFVFVGALSYLLYLNKEVGILFPLSFLVYIAFQYILDKNLKDFQINLKAFTIIFSVFILCFLLLKFTAFSNLGNSYAGQTGFSAAFELLGNKTIPFFFFSSFYFILHIIIASSFFTAIFPFVYFKNLNQNNQKAFVFLLIILVASALVIAYTVYIRDNLDTHIYDSPRAMVRYAVFLPTIFLVVFLSLFENHKIISNKKHLMLYVVFVAIILIFYKIVEGIPIDAPILFPFLKDTIFTKENFYIFKIALALVSFVVFFIFYKNSKKGISFVFSFIFIFYITCSFLLHQQFRKDYFVSESEKAEAAEVEKLIKENPNKTFLIANSGWFNRKTTRLSDTLLNYPNLVNVQTNNIAEIVSEDQDLLIAQIPFQKLWGENDPNYKPNAKENYYQGITKIDYFIFPKKTEHGIELENGEVAILNFSVFAPKGAEVLENFNGNIFTIFKNKNPEVLPFFIWIPIQ